MTLLDSHEARPPAARRPVPTQRVAVVGSGIAGLSCAWLLAGRHEVTVFEGEARPGGHSHTVDAPCADGRTVPVDTGFIVYNEPAYPNLAALFRHLDVPTAATDMSFAVSLDGGALEYAGTDLRGLFAQKRNLLRPRFWAMLRELLRFYREAPRDAAAAGDQALDDYLDARGYGRAFRDDHLYPMAAAIWSAPAAQVGRHPVASFVRFCENHGLLRLAGRPAWRTVTGGSREYVRRLAAPLAGGRRAVGEAVALGLRGTGEDHLAVAVERRADHQPGAGLRIGGVQRSDLHAEVEVAGELLVGEVKRVGRVADAAPAAGGVVRAGAERRGGAGCVDRADVRPDERRLGR